MLLVHLRKEAELVMCGTVNPTLLHVLLQG